MHGFAGTDFGEPARYYTICGYETADVHDGAPATEEGRAMHVGNRVVDSVHDRGSATFT